MTSTIRSTIIDALPGAAASDQYVGYVNDVEAALTEREYTLSDEITGQVVQHFGVHSEQVRTALEDLGMAVRPAPEPEPEAPSFLDDAAAGEHNDPAEAPAKKGKKGKKGGKRMDRLEATVQSLVDLAERHLGSRV